MLSSLLFIFLFCHYPHCFSPILVFLFCVYVSFISSFSFSPYTHHSLSFLIQSMLPSLPLPLTLIALPPQSFSSMYVAFISSSPFYPYLHRSSFLLILSLFILRSLPLLPLPDRPTPTLPSLPPLFSGRSPHLGRAVLPFWKQFRSFNDVESIFLAKTRPRPPRGLRRTSLLFACSRSKVIERVFFWSFSAATIILPSLTMLGAKGDPLFSLHSAQKVKEKSIYVNKTS